jgi:glycosyltransferase involved in cell wall biosynthesis
MNVLVFTSLWPNAEQPNFGLFVKHRVVAMSKLDNVHARVVAPTPYFPQSFRSRHLESLWPESWRKAARIPDREWIDGLETYHPRHLVTPKLGMRFYGRWMAVGVEPLVRRLRAQRAIDLIDAHYVYPDGYAATLIADRLGVPVVISARGTDINLFSRMPLIRPLIRKALTRADGVIAVSDSLRRRMIELGVEPDKVAVIRNGVDREVFYPRDRNEARRKLRLDPEAGVLVSVGALVPLKGVDRLIDAMALARDSDRNARLKLYVIGEGPRRAALESRIAGLGLADRVFLPGQREQSELADWYSAADLFCLASHREGCPNVVLEAMACGTPVIASDVGGVGELISRPGYGLLLPEPTAETFAGAISKALREDWDRNAIALEGRARSWEDVAGEILDYYAERKFEG